MQPRNTQFLWQALLVLLVQCPLLLVQCIEYERITQQVNLTYDRLGYICTTRPSRYIVGTVDMSLGNLRGVTIAPASVLGMRPGTSGTYNITQGYSIPYDPYNSCIGTVLNRIPRCKFGDGTYERRTAQSSEPSCLLLDNYAYGGGNVLAEINVTFYSDEYDVVAAAAAASGGVSSHRPPASMTWPAMLGALLAASVFWYL